MKWAYSIKNKLTASVLLFLVLAVVLLNNLHERNNTAKINNAISTIYDDRLVVESYIFRYAELLHAVIEVVDNKQLSQNEKQQQLTFPVQQIKDLNIAYAKTKLSVDEELNFNNFTGLISSLENEVNKSNFDSGKQQAKSALGILNTLSAIQITEAKLQMTKAEGIISFASITSQFEMAIIIIIALIIQVLLFASKTLQLTQIPRHSGLN